LLSQLALPVVVLILRRTRRLPAVLSGSAVVSLNIGTPVKKAQPTPTVVTNTREQVTQPPVNNVPVKKAPSHTVVYAPTEQQIQREAAQRLREEENSAASREYWKRQSDEIDEKRRQQEIARQKAVAAQQEQERQQREYQLKQQAIYEQQRSNALQEARLRQLEGIAAEQAERAAAPPRPLFCDGSGWCR
jgi:flagellar biosynthesis GTPase FlhF